MTEEIQNDMKGYLHEELDELARSTRLMAIALVVLSALTIGYFEWMKGMTAEALKPASISTLVVSEVKRNIPTATQALQTNLTRAAPEVVAFIGTSILNEVLPMMTEAATALFRDYSRELTGFGTLAIVKMFGQIVKDHKVALAKAKDTAEPAFYERDRVVEGLNGFIEVELGRRMTESPEESLGTKLKESLNALNNINLRLQELAAKRKLDRKEELGKRLITTWWTFLNREQAHDSAREAIMDANTLIPITEEYDPAIFNTGLGKER
jgi:hypothetical protein